MLQAQAVKTIGLTLKIILEVDDATAEEFCREMPGSLRIAGTELNADSLQIRAGGTVVQPARLWVRLEELPDHRIEDFLEE